MKKPSPPARKRVSPPDRLWQKFFAATDEAIFVHDAATGRILEVNDRVLKMFGYTRDETLEFSIAQELQNDPPYSSAEAQEWLRRAVAAGPQLFEWLGRRKNGERFWCEISLCKIEDRGQDKVIAVVRDITARKDAETQLRFQALLLNQIIDTVTATDLDGRITFVNDAQCRAVKRSREELLGLSVESYGEEPSRGATQRQIIEETLRKGAWHGEVINYDRDGRELTVDCRTTLIRDFSGKPIGMCGVGTDVTERRRGQEALADREQRYRSLFDLSPSGILLEDAEGNILEANPAMCRISGYSREELCDNNVRMLVPPERHSETKQHIDDLLAGKTLLHQVDNIGKDGKLRRVELHEMAVPLPDGRKGILAVVNDITERRQLEEQLRHLQKMESVGQLAAGVAHDFNNILTIINCSANILAENLANHPECQEWVTQILMACERAANLTRQLLLFSRKQQMQSQAINLNELTNNLTKMLGRVLGEDIILEFSYENDLPEVRGDPGMLEQVILNLAVNARDAMPLGGRLHISTSTATRDALPSAAGGGAQPAHYVRLAVRDTGCGIPPEIQDRIFEPFFTTKDVGKGTGLGLATVFGIVAQHMGWIEVDSKVGHGTAFIIHLPASSVPEAESTDQLAVASRQGHGETILVVEDEIAVRELMCYTLRHNGYKVMAAASGVEAKRFSGAQLKSVDLLVTDLVMPGGVNGRELAESLRRDHPRLRIIFCSGYSSEITGGRLTLDLGVSFIQKPFSLRELLGSVADLLRT